MKWIEKFRAFFEIKVFGVCSQLGEKLGIASSHIRLFFIYATFIATWSPVILYLILAFWINLKKYIKQGTKQIWDA